QRRAGRDPARGGLAEWGRRARGARHRLGRRGAARGAVRRPPPRGGRLDGPPGGGARARPRTGRAAARGGRLTDATPWADRSGVTRPYAEVRDAVGETHKLVMLVPMGENAFLSELEVFLSQEVRAR